MEGKHMAKTDFSKGPVWKLILTQALPLTIAQLVQLLYNIVDRIYLGHMEGGDSIALTGVGLTFPIVTFIAAFAALFGSGGVPLFSMSRGAGNEDRAKKIMGNAFALLLCAAGVLTVCGYLFKEPILYAFGASDESYAYANAYLRIYLAGTLFSMIASGMNGYINAQGFPRIGMLSVVLGAVTNIILDPIFIFALDMGVSGAALATVISQGVSALWICSFLFGRRISIPLERSIIRIRRDISGDICRLGTSLFIMTGTNFFVQVACNSTLKIYGGDLYIGIMTVVSSVREIFSLPVSGLINGAQPVISFNYGAKSYLRAKEGIRFNTIAGAIYTLIAWVVVLLCPRLLFRIFSDDPALVETGVKMLNIYFFGFVFMALQFAGQSTFQALGKARHAIFFSLLRKAFIVVPLTLLLPRWGMGAAGVFMAEPVSNVLGGLASYITMRLTVYKKLTEKAE